MNLKIIPAYFCQLPTAHTNLREKFFKTCALIVLRNTEIVKLDRFIKAFGQRRYAKTGKQEHTHQYISQRMLPMQKIDKDIFHLT